MTSTELTLIIIWGELKNINILVQQNIELGHFLAGCIYHVCNDINGYIVLMYTQQNITSTRLLVHTELNLSLS